MVIACCWPKRFINNITRSSDLDDLNIAIQFLNTPSIIWTLSPGLNLFKFFNFSLLISWLALINSITLSGTCAKFKPGDKVQITDGVFKNCVAIFKSFKSDERVILLMNILGQQQAINIKQESLIGL